MANSGGRVGGPIRWRIAREPRKPGTAMVLGGILTDRNNSDGLLNIRTGIVPFPEEQIQCLPEAALREMESKLIAGGEPGGQWASKVVVINGQQT
ncbi:hypothetical protein F4823DRAFT_589650 [Ustulina deusta]|nr:hypothetical protein F4823DRAFT_589650 [Ustulina deusta]